MSNTVSFTFLPASGNVPLTVDFSDTSHASPPDTILSWSWAFGDGYVSALQNPTHVYTSAAVYAVSLSVVWASFGPQGPVTQSLTVAPAVTPPGPTPPPPAPAISVNKYIALIIPEHNNAGVPTPLPPPVGVVRAIESAEGCSGVIASVDAAFSGMRERSDVVRISASSEIGDSFDPANTQANTELSNGNLTATWGQHESSIGTQSLSSNGEGDSTTHYFEFTCVADPFPDGGNKIGLCDADCGGNIFNANNAYYDSTAGQFYVNGSPVGSPDGNGLTVGDVLGFYVDLHLNVIDIYVNNFLRLNFAGALPAGGGGGTWYVFTAPLGTLTSAASVTVNFGDTTPFVYTPPFGAQPWN